MPTKICLVDDDISFCELLSEYLTEEDFVVEVAHDGHDAIEKLQRKVSEILILDVMKPGMGGLDALREIRKFSEIPVLMLTARGDDIDRIVGLELGADDYVAKPCNPREIVARLRAILRRTGASVAVQEYETLTVDDVTLYSSERAVLCNDIPLEITSTEFDVLEILLRNAGKVVEKTVVSSEALKRTLGPHDRSIDMHVSRLRRKLGELPNGTERIKTIHGTGYLYVQASGHHVQP